VCSSLETENVVLRQIFLANFRPLVAITLENDYTAAPTLREGLPRATATLARLGLLPTTRLPWLCAFGPGGSHLAGDVTSRASLLRAKRVFDLGSCKDTARPEKPLLGGALRALILTRRYSSWYRQRWRVHHRYMDSTTPNAQLTEQTEQQLQLSALGSLLERYQGDPVAMSALALAWRIGFSTAQTQSRQSMASSFINPFWQ